MPLHARAAWQPRHSVVTAVDEGHTFEPSKFIDVPRVSPEPTRCKNARNKPNEMLVKEVFFIFYESPGHP